MTTRSLRDSNFGTSLIVEDDTTGGTLAVKGTNSSSAAYVHLASEAVGSLTTPNIDSYTHAAINLSAGNNRLIVSSAANKQIWVYGIGFTLSVDGSVSFQDEDDTAITGIMPFAQYSGLNTPPSGDFKMPIWKLATDKDLEVDLVTADIDGWIDYAIVSV